MVQCRGFDEFLRMGTVGFICRYRLIQYHEILRTAQLNSDNAFAHHAAVAAVATTTELASLKNAWESWLGQIASPQTIFWRMVGTMLSHSSSPT